MSAATAVKHVKINPKVAQKSVRELVEAMRNGERVRVSETGAKELEEELFGKTERQRDTPNRSR